MKIEAQGKVDDSGQVRIYNRHIFDSMLFNHLRGKDIDIVIKRAKKYRSGNQNRYYWGVVIPVIQQGLFDTQGECLTAEEVHEFCKSNFNYKEIVNEGTGEVVRMPMKTADLSTIDFELYLDMIRTFSDEFFGVIIPLPNEQSEINY